MLATTSVCECSLELGPLSLSSFLRSLGLRLTDPRICCLGFIKFFPKTDATSKLVPPASFEPE